MNNECNKKKTDTKRKKKFALRKKIREDIPLKIVIRNKLSVRENKKIKESNTNE